MRSMGCRSSLGRLLGVLMMVVAVGAVLAAPASGRQVRQFKEAFGSAATPSFGNPLGLAVDGATGDLLVIDAANGTVSRWNPDGTPANFTDLGTNVIDGSETPQGSLSFTLQPSQSQIAVDNSGGPTDGDIYVTQYDTHLVDIFSATGGYLGQLTAAGSEPFGRICGVAAGPDGSIYVGDFGTVFDTASGAIHKFVPMANPPSNADNTATFTDFSPIHRACTLAAGTGPTADSIFGGRVVDETLKLSAATGAVEYAVSSQSQTTVSVNATNGNVLVASGEGVEEFEASGATGPLGVSSLSAGSPIQGVAAALDGTVYISRQGSPEIEVFGLPVPLPTVAVTPATNVTGTRATLNGSIDPEGVAIEPEGCFFEWGADEGGEAHFDQKTECEALPPADSKSHPVSANISGLVPDGAGYHYRLVAINENGEEVSSAGSFQTAATVTTEPPTGIGPTSLVLEGTVRPEGREYEECAFEYGLTATPGFEGKVACEPSAGEVPPDFAEHQVHHALTGLQPNTAYKFRLIATTAEGEVKGETLVATTVGPPVITEARALNATQTTVRLEGRINPRGVLAHYFIQWGPTAAYGHRVPAGSYEPSVGSGESPVPVGTSLTGLSPATTYHYRFVARNQYGTATSGDQVLETLNSCGLPEGRCFELVSPPDVGPVAAPGEFYVAGNLHFQPAVDGNSLAYAVENGLPGAIRGGEVLYRATRHGLAGWASEQIGTPITARNEYGGGTAGGSSAPGYTLGLSNDLSCGVVASSQPLANSPAMEQVREAGGGNLYRREAGGTFTAISNLAPVDPGAAGNKVLASVYRLAGMSRDCTTVAFTTRYDYPGLEAQPEDRTEGQIHGETTHERMYEWRGGTLKSVGVIPGPSGDTQVPAVPGGGQTDHWNAVSTDGARIFFSAHRLVPGNPGDPDEAGKVGVFVRENGAITRDLSASETSTPDLGAEYQYATPDGSRVFFTANAGLTESSSPEGTDLYEYDLEKAPGDHPLTDLSVETAPGGARVTGFVGASADGSHVYFLAEGQLVPGRGKTLAENQADETYGLYSKAADVAPRFVATVRAVEASEAEDGGLAVQPAAKLTSRVSASGRFLLFETGEKVAGVPGSGGGARQAYLYDAARSTDPIVCVSCQQNGEVSLGSPRPLQVVGGANELFQSRSLVVRGGSPIVFFRSTAPLTGEAGQGELRLYEWAHDQVFLLSGPTATGSIYAGLADEDASDVFISTSARLTWEDGDERRSVYDARIGGGFSPPPSGPAPCSPTAEGSCQGSPAGPGVAPNAGTASFNGPGNVHRKRKVHKRKRKHHHHKKQGKKQRNAKANGKRHLRSKARHGGHGNGKGRAGR